MVVLPLTLPREALALFVLGLPMQNSMVIRLICLVGRGGSGCSGWSLGVVGVATGVATGVVVVVVVVVGNACA